MPTDTDAPKDAPEGEAPVADAPAPPSASPSDDAGVPAGSLTANRIAAPSAEPDETLTASKPAPPAGIDPSLAAIKAILPAEVDASLKAEHEKVTLGKNALPPAARLAAPIPPSARALRIRRALQATSKAVDARTPGFVRTALRDWGGRSARLLDFLAVEERRRLRSAIALAIAFNIIMFTALAVFGKFRIWIPSAPGDTLSIVMVELPQPFPELRDPEIVPEPEPEIEPPPEPEVIEEPELKPEPAPNPVEEPEPEAAPEPEPELQPEPEPAPPEPEPDPEPVLDLSPDPVFAPPAEVEEAPFIPEPETPAPPEEEPLIIADEPQPTEEPQPEPAPVEEVVQSPAEEAPPLVEAEPQVAPQAEPSEALEVTEAEEEEKDEEGELAPAAAAAEEAPSGDDMFDEEPVFGASRTPLPAVDLPEGAAPATPGSSGVIAIFCPEEFTDKDKAAECAGRTEIRSGWRPGASGENWDEAIRLLKADRASGQGGTDPQMIYGPAVGNRMEQEQRLKDVTDFRRGVDINDPAGAAAGNLNDTLGKPDIGPDAANPNWTLREDPNVSEKDLRQLEKALEEAQRKREPQ